MAYDAARGRIVLFGGLNTDGVRFGDTWEWDGASWHLGATTGPAPSYWSSLAYDSNNHLTMLYGGVIGRDGEAVW